MAKKLQCPGQDQRFWTADDIFDVKCPNCGNILEFWKDDPYHTCKKCEKTIRNPRLNIGCAEWCKNSEDCLIGELFEKEKE